MIEWIEFNPTMICQSPFLQPQPTIKGKFTGCSYCYSAEGMPHTTKEVRIFKEKELATEQIQNFIDQISELGIKRMCILGGGPQLRDDFNEIMMYACKKITLVHLTTNGIGTKKHLETLLKIPLLEISIDSNKIVYASQVRPLLQVQAAFRSIDLLHKKHPFLCINTVVTPSVLPSLWNFIRWAFNEKNIKKINLYPLLNGGSKELRITRAQAEEIMLNVKANYKIITENYCKSGKHMVVDYDGSIVPCAAFLGSGVNTGNALHLKEAMNNPLLKKFQKYNFKSIAPKSSKAFESPNCPGKKLYDSNWMEPAVEKTSIEFLSTDKYCMRCSTKQDNDATTCKYCGFCYFDNKPFSMVCSCFSILNPKYF